MTKDTFFDRKSYLDILNKRITDIKDGYRQNLAIIGDEQVGKTSIVFKFLNNYYDNRTIITYLEIRPESLVSFARRFIGILLYNFLVNSGIAMEENIEFLISKSEKYAPRTVEKIKLILLALEKRKKNNIFTELLSLTEMIYQETGKICVVIFDEFHNLENMGIKYLYSEWSRILVLQKNVLYIIISSMKLKAKLILSKNLSLLFGNFQIITVEPFDIRTSEEYINYRLGGAHLDQPLKDFVVHFTGGNPFYLELISKELLKARSVNLSDILEDLLFLPEGMLNQKFSNYLKRFLDIPHSHDYIAILYLIADGRNKLKDIAHLLRIQRKELMLRVNHLMELETIGRNGDFLKINDRVLGFWLRFVYQEKLQSLTFDSNNQKVIFRHKIDSMIKEFLSSAQKTLKERTMELLHLFEDDVIQMERKRLRLSHFREIKTLEFNSRRLMDGVIGRSQDNLWIVAFKNGSVTEEDIADFSKECKKYRHKLQMKIIVSCQDIEANTRLKALEEKVLTWDLNNFNQIMDLFSKPRVIAGV